MVTIVDFLAQAVKNKPTDGSDCKSLASAQKELGRLRRITGKVVKVLSNARDLAALNGNSNGAIAPAPQAQDHAPDEKKSRPSVKKRKASRSTNPSKSTKRSRSKNPPRNEF